MKSEKELLIGIIEITAYVDEESHVWGKDTDLGTLKEIQADIKEKIKHLIISPMQIEKDIANVITALNRENLKLEIKLKNEKSKKLGELFKLEVKKEKEMTNLKDNFHIMNKEYSKLLREWIKLKYPKTPSDNVPIEKDK